MVKRRRKRPTIMDRIVMGAFQWGLSTKQIARALKMPKAEVEEAMRRGWRW